MTNRIRLKYLAAAPITNGLGLSGAFDDGGWPRYIRTTDIKDERTLRDDVFASQPPSVAAGAMVKPRDILMTAAGATIGKSYLHSGTASACYAGYLARFRPIEKVDERYISYWMQSADYWAQIDTGAVRSTIDNFSAGKYRQLLVPMLPLDQQRQIADFLDDQVARIDEIIRLRNEQLSEIWHGFDSACAELTVRADGELVPLRRVVSRLQTGSTPTVDDIADADVTGAVDWFTPASFGMAGELAAPVKRFGSAVSRAEGLVRFEPDTVLLVGIGATAGRVAYLTQAAAGNQQLTAISTNERMLPRFLLWHLHALRNDVRAYAPFTTLPILNNDFLRSVLVTVPALDVQRESVDVLDERRAWTNAAWREMNEQIELLQERKRSLITAAVTGEFDVTAASGRGVA